MRALPYVAILLLAACTGPVKEVRGVATPSTTIAAGAAANPKLAMLLRALRTAELVDTLQGGGPYTLFAPTDEAFGRLPPRTANLLLKPENRAELTKLLRLHLIRGRLTVAELSRRVTASNGAMTLATISGEPLTVTLTRGTLTLTDSGGNRSYVERADIRQSNGVIHIVNGVLAPRVGQ